MPLLELLRVAFAAIAANKLRSLLTALGIIIGIAAVIAMVALGEGAQQAVQSRLQGMGANVLTIRHGQAFFGGVAHGSSRLKIDDAEKLGREATVLVGVAPELEGRLQVENGTAHANLSILGSWPDYFAMNNFELAAGRLFGPRDEEGRRRVAVLGALAGEQMGAPASSSLIGQTIRIRSVPFEVIGVLAEKGSQGFSSPDEAIYVPISIARFTVSTLSNFITGSIATLLSRKILSIALRVGLSGSKPINFSPTSVFTSALRRRPSGWFGGVCVRSTGTPI